MNLFSEIVRLQEQGVPCALCTIVKTTGSTPGKTMMKMLVRHDGSFAGTVGGGCLEAEVLEAALESMEDEKPRTLAFSLNERDYPDSGLLCGGKVEIFVEPIVEPRLYLFGGGHVSRSLARIARMVGFHVTVGDDRESYASAEMHPEASELASGEFVDQVARIAPAQGQYLVVVTRGHQSDGDILHAIWEAGCKPRFLAMIGSRAKRKQVFDALEARGVGREFLESVRTPMGLPIGARTHEEIAVSVAAELIAVRRGEDPGIGPR